MNELYILNFSYDVILGQSYTLVPMPYTPVSEGFINARNHLIADTNRILQRPTNGKNR